MTRTETLTSIAARLVELVARHASAGDWASARHYEERLRRCRALLSQTQTPGF